MTRQRGKYTIGFSGSQVSLDMLCPAVVESPKESNVTMSKKPILPHKVTFRCSTEDLKTLRHLATDAPQGPMSIQDYILWLIHLASNTPNTIVLIGAKVPQVTESSFDDELIEAD